MSLLCLRYVNRSSVPGFAGMTFHVIQILKSANLHPWRRIVWRNEHPWNITRKVDILVSTGPITLIWTYFILDLDESTKKTAKAWFGNTSTNLETAKQLWTGANCYNNIVTEHIEVFSRCLCCPAFIFESPQIFNLDASYHLKWDLKFPDTSSKLAH